jgi:hypothetical protein
MHIWKMEESLKNVLDVTKSRCINVPTVIILPSLSMPSVEIVIKHLTVVVAIVVVEEDSILLLVSCNYSNATLISART